LLIRFSEEPYRIRHLIEGYGLALGSDNVDELLPRSMRVACDCDIFLEEPFVCHDSDTTSSMIVDYHSMILQRHNEVDLTEDILIFGDTSGQFCPGRHGDYD
jgi:hypothetical protein